jgi:3-oxoacyl-(acyl-carrier-protein) synthase
VRRVAIVGMGIVSAISNNVRDVLASLQQGRSGIELIPERKELGFRSALDGQIRNLAAIYAELVGYAMNSDGYDMTIPSGEGSRRCMYLALEDVGIMPEQVDYINAHASSTPVGVEEIDPRCREINLVVNQAREARIEVAASNAFGVGGVNTCIVVKRHLA